MIEFKTESYWHFSHFAYDYVIPKHIFENIGYDRWNSWNPIFNATESYVTAGPFRFDQYLPGEFIELSADTDYWYYPGNQTTTTTVVDDPFLIPAIAISGVSVIVIVVVAAKKGLITIPDFGRRSI